MVMVSALLTESTIVALNLIATTLLTVIVVVGVTVKLVITFGISPVIGDEHLSIP